MPKIFFFESKIKCSLGQTVSLVLKWWLTLVFCEYAPWSLSTSKGGQTLVTQRSCPTHLLHLYVQLSRYYNMNMSTSWLKWTLVTYNAPYTEMQNHSSICPLFHCLSAKKIWPEIDTFWGTRKSFPLSLIPWFKFELSNFDLMKSIFLFLAIGQNSLLI